MLHSQTPQRRFPEKFNRLLESPEQVSLAARRVFLPSGGKKHSFRLSWAVLQSPAKSLVETTAKSEKPKNLRGRLEAVGPHKQISTHLPCSGPTIKGGSSLSHDQNLVLNWSTQNHVQDINKRRISAPMLHLALSQDRPHPARARLDPLGPIRPIRPHR